MKKIIFVLSISVFIFLVASCKKENTPEIIGVSNELTAYERYVEDVNSGRIDSSAFIYTNDGGSLYYSYYFKSVEVTDLGFSTGNQSTSLTKLDKNGYFDWQFFYGDSMEFCLIDRLIQDDNGSIVFGASKINFLDYSTKSYLVKIGEQGDLLFEKEIPGKYSNIACQTKDGGYIFTSCLDSILYIIYNEESGNIEEIKRDSYFEVLKTNNLGEVEWETRDGTIDKVESPLCAIQTEDQGFLVLIRHIYSPYKDPIYTTAIKLNTQGVILKETHIENNIMLSDIIKANDDGYILASTTYPENSKKEIILTKLNNQGDIVWQKTHKVDIIWGSFLLPDEYYHIDFRILTLLNTAYFVIEQNLDSPHLSSIYKFNNSGDLIE